MDIANLLFGIRSWLNPTIKRMPEGHLVLWVLLSPFAGLMVMRTGGAWVGVAMGVDDDGDPVSWGADPFVLCHEDAPPPEVARSIMTQCEKALVATQEDLADPWAMQQLAELRAEGWI